MDINVQKKGENLIVHLSGELDHHTSNLFREKIDRELKKGIYDNLVLDLSNLSFMDSSGIGAVLGRYKKIKSQNGQVFACGMNEQVKKLAEMSGLTKVINYYQNLSELERKL
ncbi:anti-sigma F factor antagonist [Natranaerobius trueperi]|uniref:Anti-sigma F factor antagonist n=1 Tax=Natranaerobius trueperi TaxID=759412 RepID=A0A226C063_9FIRM|nr:anti-sigma F factor antagonist [Natranaerobius trueperi]OWZ83984.1 anti-sigma F factor antagonist [Natranaerobius trueperi]